MLTLEIAIASAEDACIAENAGAQRFELSAALELGGLTPSLGLLREVAQSSSLPLIVMIRPRSGSFCYTSQEFRTMQRDAVIALENGAAGIAFGILQPDGSVDGNRCGALVRSLESRGKSVFHRAFDCCSRPSLAIEQLIDLGIHRVMTSGLEPTAIAGASMLASLKAQAKERIEVLAAGGIRAAQVSELARLTQVRQIHAGPRTRRADGAPDRLMRMGIARGANGSDGSLECADGPAILELAWQCASA